MNRIVIAEAAKTILTESAAGLLQVNVIDKIGYLQSMKKIKSAAKEILVECNEKFEESAEG